MLRLRGMAPSGPRSWPLSGLSYGAHMDRDPSFEDNLHKSGNVRREKCSGIMTLFKNFRDPPHSIR
jgi:hypothetical protein